ncbi:MAG: cytochrome b [Caulobacterales bacterium]|nr:cytochrome b [Caulobacterales bacterium]
MRRGLAEAASAVTAAAALATAAGLEPAHGQEIGSIHPVFGPIGTNDHRLPFHLDSIMALGLVAYALIVTWMMKHARPGLRVMGIWGAALGCLGVAAGVLWLDLMGAFDELRPAIFPTDDGKPVVMRVLAGVFAAGGVILAMVAMGQTKRADVLTLGARNEPERYGRRARYFHWTIAILFILLVPMGIFTSMIPVEHEYRQAYYVIHKSIGFTVMILAVARLIWLIMSPAPKLDAGLSGWEKFLAHSAHYTLYFFLFAFPISGFLLSTYGGKLSHFYFWDTPLFWGPSVEGVRLPSLMHKLVLPYLFYLVLLGHILGALKHQFIDKHAHSFRRMVT